MKKIDYYVGKNRKDVLKIQEILKEKGYEATLYQCEELWRGYSQDICAGWMYVGDNAEDVFENISSYIEN